MSQLPYQPLNEAGDLREDVQTLFEELTASLPPDARGVAGECHPTIDVRETDRALEVMVDVPGVPADALRLLFRGSVLVVAGHKLPNRPANARTFHLVEREFGRFARAIRVSGAFDIAAARARLQDGELHIVLPKRQDRRGQSHRIPVVTPGADLT